MVDTNIDTEEDDFSSVGDCENIPDDIDDNWTSESEADQTQGESCRIRSICVIKLRSCYASICIIQCSILLLLYYHW